MNIHLFSYKCLLFQTGESHSEKINENKCKKIACFCHYFINLKLCSYTCAVNKYYRRAPSIFLLISENYKFSLHHSH